MGENTQPNKKQLFLTSFIKAMFFNFVIFLLVFSLSKILGGPNMTISEQTAKTTFFILLVIYFLINLWSLAYLVPKWRGGKFPSTGPFKYVRLPMHGAVILILNPAISILFRSWLLIFASIVLLFAWRAWVETGEKKLAEKFGEQYLKYKKTTWQFFPDLLKINKPLFFVATMIAVFMVAFVSLNSSSFYIRAVEWRQAEAPKIVVQNQSATSMTRLPEIQAENPVARPRPQYNIADSIIIEKINVNAPLVFAAGTTQKDLNLALDQGVVIYPESKLPGETGEVFLTGHSSVYPWNKTKYGQVFTLLDKLEAGDLIVVYYNHYKYEYQVTGKQVMTPDKATLNSQTEKETITLMTCWPIGTAWKRLVVEGVIIE